jgi:23S rRNA (uracil1939-C5)-methyltransferase
VNPLELHIQNIAAGGAGVAHAPDGRAVFVHRTAPGDVVRAQLVEEKKRWARARLLEIIEPGPGRRVAPCPHYARCGGCTLEHLDYGAQLEAKRTLVREALARIGSVALAAPPEITASPAEFRYRNRVSFTLLRVGERAIAGFHELDRPGRIMDIDGTCLLPEAPVAAAWDALRARWGQGARLLPRGRTLRLTLRASATGTVTLLVEGGAGGDAPALLAAVPQLAAIWHRPHPGSRAELRAGTEAVPELWDEESLALSGTLFLQVNRAAATLLEQHVLAVAGDVAGRRVVDAYCGVGLHARRLARRGAQVLGLELDPHALAVARDTAEPGLEFREGRVEDLLADVLPADLVILNPPRSGVAAGAIEALLASPPARLIYVSCDPATLARDLARLGTRCGLRSIRCFDLFPQTSHVETVVELACSTT